MMDIDLRRGMYELYFLIICIVWRTGVVIYA